MAAEHAARISLSIVALLAADLLVMACSGAPSLSDETGSDGGEGGAAPDAGGDAGAPDAPDAQEAADAEAPCDADTDVDPASCGACGNPCAPGQSCSFGACVCGPLVDVSFSKDVQPIFAQSCTFGMCHPNGAGAVGMELGTGKAYGSLVGVLAAQCRDGRVRVLPGQPSESYLIDKLMGVQICSGLPMPPSGPVARASVETVVAWICAGALDN